MRTVWEYAQLDWQLTSRRIQKSDPDYALLPQDEKEKWDEHSWAYYKWVEQHVTVRLPGEEATTSLQWQSFDASLRFTVLSKVQELGADGWELVSARDPETRVEVGRAGLDGVPVGTPIRSAFYFKRPKDADD